MSQLMHPYYKFQKKKKKIIVYSCEKVWKVIFFKVIQDILNNFEFF